MENIAAIAVVMLLERKGSLRSALSELFAAVR